MPDSLAAPECAPMPHDPVLSTRQEAFCRHFTASGNAADAARRAGYAEGSARQTGHALLERPYIVERVRQIRMSWQRTARDEARIALARLEQAWDAAVAGGSAYLMLQTVRLQAEIAGLVRPAGMRRAVLWPMAGEDEFGEMAEGDAPEAGTAPGPLADAVRRGRARAERALARHCAGREALEEREDFDEIAHAATAERLADAVEERERLPVGFEPPAPPPAADVPSPTTLPRRLTTKNSSRPNAPANSPATTGSMAQRPCAGAGPGPSGRSPATAPAGRRWRNGRTSMKSPMRQPPKGSPTPSRSESACPSASSRPPRPRRRTSLRRRPSRGDLRRKTVPGRMRRRTARRRQGRWRRRRLALPAPQRFRRNLRPLDAGEHRTAEAEQPRMGRGALRERPLRPVHPR